MISYGKTARCALAALCHLAKSYESGIPLGSQKISEAINLPQTLVAKVLTTVSTAGLIEGTRGPKGGYILARSPSEINVYQIVKLFGQDKNNDDFCPMGPTPFKSFETQRDKPCEALLSMSSLAKGSTPFNIRTSFPTSQNARNPPPPPFSLRS